jgi:hypothetical protein
MKINFENMKIELEGRGSNPKVEFKIRRNAFVVSTLLHFFLYKFIFLLTLNSTTKKTNTTTSSLLSLSIDSNSSIKPQAARTRKKINLNPHKSDLDATNEN